MRAAAGKDSGLWGSSASAWQSRLCFVFVVFFKFIFIHVITLWFSKETRLKSCWWTDLHLQGNSPGVHHELGRESVQLVHVEGPVQHGHAAQVGGPGTRAHDGGGPGEANAARQRKGDTLGGVLVSADRSALV